MHAPGNLLQGHNPNKGKKFYNFFSMAVSSIFKAELQIPYPVIRVR